MRYTRIHIKITIAHCAKRTNKNNIYHKFIRKKKRQITFSHSTHNRQFHSSNIYSKVTHVSYFFVLCLPLPSSSTALLSINTSIYYFVYIIFIYNQKKKKHICNANNFGARWSVLFLKSTNIFSRSEWVLLYNCTTRTSIIYIINTEKTINRQERNDQTD